MAYPEEQKRVFRDEYLKHFSIKKAMQSLGYPGTRDTAHRWTTYVRSRINHLANVGANENAYAIVNDLKRFDEEFVAEKYSIDVTIAHLYKYYIFTSNGRFVLATYILEKPVSVETLAERLDVPVLYLKMLGFMNDGESHTPRSVNMSIVDKVSDLMRDMNEEILKMSLKYYE